MPTPFDAVHIGARVVVRYRLGTDPQRPAEGPSMTDATGDLVARTDSAVVVLTRRGEVTIPRDRIVAAKEIPPRPSRRGAPHLAPTVAELQRIAGPSWGAVERDRLGDWELRASAGFTQRGNSVLPVGDPGVPLADAVDRIEEWYAVRGLPAKVALAGPVGFEPADDSLGAELLRRGWTAGDRTLNLTAACDAIAAADPGGPDVRITADLDDTWLAAYSQSRAVIPDVTTTVLGGSPGHLFGSISLGGGLAQKLGLSTPGSRAPRPVAIGRLGLAHGWAGLGALWTDPGFRGRGLGTRITAALAARARADGIHLMHLQVEADNDVAIRVYERLGFARHSNYVYLTAPG
ncbi:GNAT family N-acetyltransferase [Knoellia sinensis]|uniref:GNAT family N-acetyltransferase n=1 Tax=Knoellia sinensis TaxID=136100 RepID=UPI0012EB07FA|nr:GNAT family N-acetyltransferase [Knoellia sinensis]